jgi:gliding motility-associated-like protein
MKKITLLLITLCFSLSGYSQLALEGFESTTGPATLPSTTWTLGTGNWAVFDNGTGLGQRWGINSTVTTPAIVYQGTNAAYVNRENIGQGNTSEDYLATPLVTIPTNGQLHFYTRSFTTGNQGTLYQIKVAPVSASQTNPAAYTLVQQWTEVDLTSTYNIYEEKIVSLAAYAGQQVYVSFVKVYSQPSTTLDGDRWLVDNVSIIEQCLDPISLTASGITQTSANLSWGNPSGATSWEIEILPSANAFTGVGVVYNGALPYNATTTATGVALTPSTDYKYYVRALCSNGGKSLWIGPYLFSTSSPGLSCSAPILITSLPYSTTDNTANYSDNLTIEGLPGTSCGVTNGYLNGNDVVYAFTPTTSGNVNVTMTPSATYSGIFVYNSCANIGVSCIAGAGDSGTTVRTFDLTVTAGTTYYIVISTWATPQTTAYTLTLQSVNCPPPTTLTATGIGQTVANLSWANPGGATSWEYAVQLAGSPIPTGSGTQTNSNTNNPVTNLNSGTNYQFYVRANCGNGTFSAWAGPFLFSTAANYCAGNHFYDTGGASGVYNNSANVTTVICPNSPGDQVTVIFNTFNLESGYDYLKIYDGNSSAATLLGNFTGATIPPSFTSSAVNGCLTFVFTSDSSVTLAGWEATIICSPPPTCPKPTEILISNVGQTTATVTWTEVGTATTWEVLILPSGSTAPLPSATGTITTINPYFANNLTSATTYDVYVRARCSSSDISFWSNIVTFTTLISNDECANAVNAPVNNTTTCTLTASGALIGATASIQGNTCAGTDDDDVWFQFTATSTQHIISLLNVAGSTNDLFHVLYSGNCGALTQLYCSDPNTSTASNLIPGQTYFIRIYSYTSTPGQTTTFSLCIGTPVPPPTCINNQPAGNTCQTATPICNLNGYCGSTSSSYTADYWSQLNSIFCGSIENNSFLTFVATSNSISFDVWVTSSQNNDGIQIMIFSATNCSGPVTDYTCWSPGIVPVGATNISATGLIVGNTYYIMIDGYGGDVCDYVIAANSGIQTQVNATTSNDTICMGGNVNLDAAGGNGTYNWTSSPATTGLSASTGSAITFTPTAAGVYTITATSTDGNTVCPQDVSDSVTITVNEDTIPVFDTFGPYCSGVTIPALPNTSNNGIIGTWSPAIVNNTQSGSYTFTPNDIDCSTPITITITVNPTVNPTFNTIPVLCYGDTVPVLPTLSNNNVTGVWNPLTIDNTQSGTYTFTPDAGQCATSFVNNISVNQIITPTFLSPAPICSGDTAPILPSTSLNGITGTWSPSLVNNTQTTTYTFTPDAGQCATTTTLVITVYQNCSFGSFASAVWLNNCETGNFFNTVGSGASIIGPAQNIFPNTDFGTYVSFSNTFKLRGAEVKTFKIATANVCSARLNYRIYPASGTPGAFSVLNLPFLDDCASGSFPSGGPCSNGDQKWQKVLTDAELPIDLTAYPAGEYILEVYYEVTGDINSTSQCDDTILINNNGANFIATYTLQSNPIFTAVSPSTCIANDGSITMGSLAPNTTYQLTYSDDTVVVGPITITTNASGEYTISGLNVGTYADFSFSVNSCSFNAPDTITFVIPLSASVVGTDPLTCNGTTGTITIGGLIPNQVYAVSYTDDTFTVGPTNYTSDVSGQIIITGLNAGVYTDFNLINASCSVTSNQVINLINPGAPVVTVNSVAICNTQSAVITATPQDSTTYNFVWTVPVGFTNPGNINSFSTAIPGTYTVVATPNTPLACSSSPTSGEVSIIPSTTITLTSNNNSQIVCINLAIANIVYTSTDATSITVTGLPAGVTGTFDSGTGTFTISGTPTESGIFNFTVAATGICNTVPLTGTIEVKPYVTATFSPITICNGDAVSLPTTSIEGYTGTWSPATANNTQTGTYTFTLNSSVCGPTSALTITVNPIVNPTFNAFAPLCIGETAPSLPASSNEGVTGTWLPSVIDNTTSGTYIFIPSSGQCAANGALAVTVQSGFDFDITGSCVDNNFILEVTAVNNTFDINAASFAWFNGAQQLIGSNMNTLDVTQYLNSTSVIEELPVSFNVTVTTPDGCLRNESITLDRIFCGIQKGISVNNDNNNDFFDLRLLDVKNLSIYNRYGMKIYSKNQYKDEWKGQSDNGDALPDGTYYYIIEFNNGSEAKTGWIYKITKN